MSAVTVGALLAACGTDPHACTESIEPALIVRAIDGFTGENVTDGAAGTVVEGEYSDSLRPGLIDGTGRVLTLHAADERPGSYDLFVERDGYQAVSISGIEVTMGECHVNTVDYDVTMVSFSSSTAKSQAERRANSSSGAPASR